MTSLFSPMPSIDQYNTLEDTSGRARPSDDFDMVPVSEDHIANLLSLRDLLIEQRRTVVRGVMSYQVVYVARAQDLAQIEPLIDATEAAIEHEKRLQAAGEFI